MSTFADHVPNYLERVTNTLEQQLPPAGAQPPRLHEAMRYASLNGGKRLRPLLVYASGQIMGIAPEKLDAPAAAVELIHAFSLVHDDLPAMDDDDLRRGQPTCHKAYDDATAILAGDALHTLAFDTLASATHIEPIQRVAMIQMLAKSSGSLGMCGGQAIDISLEGQEQQSPTSEQDLSRMHAMKTGALIWASIMMPTRLAERDDERDQALATFAGHIGLAFQVKDDVLDVTADTETLGKDSGSDIANDKTTYVSLLGLEEAQQRVYDLHNAAVAALDGMRCQSEPLRWLADYVINRGS